MSAVDRPVLAWNLAGTAAYGGVDPTLKGRAFQDALRGDRHPRRLLLVDR